MATLSQPETEDQRAERLLRIGLDMAVRIREEPPDAVVREMHGLDRGELRDLALLMAACVDTSRHVSEVVWWTPLDRAPVKRRVKPDGGSELRPCGTRAAYNRHIANGERLDLACELTYRREENERRVRRLRAARAVPSLPPGEPSSASDRDARMAA